MTSNHRYNRPIVLQFNFRLVCYFIISLNKIYFTTQNVQITQRHHANSRQIVYCCRRATKESLPNKHYKPIYQIVLTPRTFIFIANVHNAAADHVVHPSYVIRISTSFLTPTGGRSGAPLAQTQFYSNPLDGNCAISPPPIRSRWKSHVRTNSYILLQLG